MSLKQFCYIEIIKSLWLKQSILFTFSFFWSASLVLFLNKFSVSSAITSRDNKSFKYLFNRCGTKTVSWGTPYFITHSKNLYFSCFFRALIPNNSFNLLFLGMRVWSGCNPDSNKTLIFTYLCSIWQFFINGFRQKFNFFPNLSTPYFILLKSLLLDRSK